MIVQIYKIFLENKINSWSGFDYDRDDKKVETEIFIYSINEENNYARNRLQCIC